MLLLPDERSDYAIWTGTQENNTYLYWLYEKGSSGVGSSDGSQKNFVDALDK